MEVFTHNLANNLSKLGHNITVLAPKIKCKFDKDSVNYRIGEFRYPFSQRLGDATLVLKLFETKFKAKFEILQACLTYPPGYCGAIFKKFINIPLIVRAGGADIQKLPDINYGLRLNSRIEKKIRFALQNADAIVANSDYIEKGILQLGNFKPKISIIPNGINTERFEAKKDDNLLRKYKIPPENQIILAVGRYHIKKGFEYLLSAIKEVMTEVKDVTCVIIGRGNTKLLNIVRKLNLTNNVTIIDEIQDKNEILNFNKIPSDEIVSFYCSSDIYVSTSLIEGFPTTNIEALAAGLPLILTDDSQESGWTKEYLRNNVNGFQMAPRDIQKLKNRLLTLLTDSKLRVSMGRESKKISKKFAWKEISKKYLEFYRTLLH